MKRSLLVLLVALFAIAFSCRKAEEVVETSPPAPDTMVSTPAPQTPPATAAPAAENLPAGCMIHLRADAGVTSGADGSVSGWSSSVGGLQAAQADAARQPKLSAGAINGHASIRFDGEDDILEAPLDINPEIMPSLTVVSVFRSETAEPSPLRKLYGHDDGGYDRAAGLDNRAVRNYTIFGGGSSVVPYFTLVANTWYISVDAFNENTTFSGWVNGANVLDRAPMKHGEGLKTFFIGGTGTVYNEAWQGDIAEMLVFNRLLNDAERRGVEEMLAAKYGITLAAAQTTSAEP